MEKFLIEVSARHVHLNSDAVDVLFGKAYNLKLKKSLSQKGQYLCEEKVAVVGSRAQFAAVSVLGPVRENVQVELSKTDARSIGVDAPIRESGDLKGSGSCKLVGPKGEIYLKEGVIVSKRHIHVNNEGAKLLNVKDKDVVCVNICSKDRSAILKDVVVRVSDDFTLSMHIDTDEANAINFSGEKGEVIKVWLY